MIRPGVGCRPGGPWKSRARQRHPGGGGWAALVRWCGSRVAGPCDAVGLASARPGRDGGIAYLSLASW